MTIPRRALGNTGLWVSVLGYGGASIGFAGPERKASFIPLLQHAFDLGINFFDTAPDYRDSEALIGRAFSGRRSEVVLATKCGRIQSWNGTGWEVREDWSEAGVLKTIDRSLRHLQTDYLDLVQLHSPPLRVLDDGGALRGLLRAQQAGKVRQIGVSADGAEAWRALELGVFATLQVSYNILDQEPDGDLLPAAAARGMGIIVKQPVANGIPDMDRRPDHPDWARQWEIARRLDWAALGVQDTRLPLALRWVLSNPLVSTAIAGTTEISHLEANVGAAMQGPLDAGHVRHARDAYNAAQARLSEEQCS